MGKPHPIELRVRVVAFVDEGHGHREAARHFRVSPKFVNDLIKPRRETGSLAPRPQGNGGGYGKLAGGMVTSLLATVTFMLGAKLAMLRDEPNSRRWLDRAAVTLPALAVVVDGHAASLATGDGSGRIIAIALVVAATLAERADVMLDRQWWVGSPASYLMVAAIGAVFGSPVVGLALAAVYATATLASDVEAMRHQA